MWTTVRTHARIALVLAVITGGAGLWILRFWLVHSVLPDVVRPQLSAALKREVAFSGVDIGFGFSGSYFAVQDFRVARGATFRDGILVSCRKFVLEYRFWRLLELAWHPARLMEAVTRVELQQPVVTLDLADLRPPDHPSRHKAKAKLRPNGGEDAAASLASLPPLPKTFLKLVGGTVLLTSGQRMIMEVKGIGGTLDLRDVPHIEGGLKFVIAPDSEVSMNGKCHLGLRSFDGGLEIDRLDLAQFTAILREFDPSVGVGLAGRLRANVELTGGFMTMREFTESLAGRGSLELTGGSLVLHGTPLISELDTSGTLDERQITLDQLHARIATGQLEASGSLGNLGRGTLRLKGTLSGVPVGTLRTFSPGLPSTLDGAFTFAFSASGTGVAPVFAGKLTAPAIGVPGVRFEGLVAEAVYNLDSVTLTHLTARLWDGTFAGNGRATGLRSGRPPDLQFSLRGAGFDVARSPIGRIYEGRADLSVTLAGAGEDLQGDATARIIQVRALGLPQGDIAATAHFENGSVHLEAETSTHSVQVAGTIPLTGTLVCEACRARVQETIPRILALAGVVPPPGLDGRASGDIRIAGPLAEPTISADAVGSGVRVDRMAIGDTIHIPEFVFRENRLEIPARSPATVEWSGDNTRLRLYGKLPLGVFTGTGQQDVALRLELAPIDAGLPNLSVLKRLNIIQGGEGHLAFSASIEGTASYPVITNLAFDAGGKTLMLAGSPFPKPFEKWAIGMAFPYLNESEIAITRFEFTLDKEHLAMPTDEKNRGRFSFNGWKLASLSLPFDFVGKRGLPVRIENVADIRVSRLKAIITTNAEGNGLLITGPDAQTGAEIELANGVISYGGGESGGEKPAASPGSPAPAAGASTAGTAAVKGPPPPSDPLAEWAKRSLSIAATVTTGRNVTFAPRTLGEKFQKDLASLVTAIKGDKSAMKNLLKKYTSAEGLADLVRVSALEFSVRVREGSSLKFAKLGADGYAMSGKFHLEPNGKVSLRLPKYAPPLITFQKQDFFIVDEPGQDQYIEFPESIEPGKLHALVNVTAETVLYGKILQDAAGEAATVDELHVRLILTPPPLDLDAEATEKTYANQFLWFQQRFATEPTTVTGEVAVVAGGPGASAGAAGSAGPTGSAAGAGATGAAAAQPQTRSVTIEPDQGMILAALTNLDQVAASTQQVAQSGNMMTAVINVLKPIGVGYLLDYLVLRPFKFGLEVIGVDPDVLAIKQSDVTKSRQNTPAPQAVTAAGGATPTGGQLTNLSSALDNTELTIGKTIAKNLYVDYHAILLDSSGLTGGVSGRNATTGTSQQTNTYGQLIEMEYKAGRAKLTGRYRAFALPDDPKQDKPYEVYIGTEIGESFDGLAQREKFTW